MSWRLVEGIPLPDAVGGHPALDFCNTRAGWGNERPKEYLTAPAALALWARDNALLDPAGVAAGVPAGADGDTPEQTALARALTLRDALYPCALGAGAPQDWVVVSREAALARAAAALVPNPPGARASWRPRRSGPAEAALAMVAIAAEDLLTSSLAGFVGACPGEGCGWLFADRRRRRRWCSMAACGNRAKARRYAERHGSRP